MSNFIEQYIKIIVFIFGLCGNEFVTQLLLVTLLFIPLKKRKLFFVRFPLCIGAIIGLQYLLPINAPWHYVEIAFLLFATIAFCFEYNIIQALFISTCIYAVQFIISMLTYSITYFIMFVTNDMSTFGWYYLIMPLTLAGLMVVASKVLVKGIAKKDKLEFTNYNLFYTSLVFLAVAVFLSHYGSFAAFYSLLAQLCLKLTSMFLAISTLIICFMNVKNKNLQFENQVLQQLLYKDKQRYEQAKLSNEKIQIKYHDLKKREKQGIIDYGEMEEIAGDREILNSTYFTENKALDVILSEKALMCERLNIRLVCTADGKSLNYMKSHHIYSFFGNALDNAIESVKKIDDEELRQIDISITERGNMSVISVSNYISGEGTVFDEGMPLTTKHNKEEHGYGTKSMRRVVEYYGGNITFKQENGVFTMLAVIPCPLK